MSSTTTQSDADVAALFATALRHHQTGNLPEAELAYREILSLRPRHIDSLHLLGMVVYQSGYAGIAVDLIQHAIALNPKEALFHSNLGVVLNALGKLDQAVESYQKALALKPNYSEAHSNLGNAFVSKGKFTEALFHLNRALNLDPDNVSNQVNIGVALAEQGDYVAAISHYEKAIALNPDHPDSLLNLGNAFQALGRLPEAVACYQRVLARTPTYLTALYNLGNAYQGLDNLEQAHKTYDSALAINPNYRQAVYGKALAQLLEGNFIDGWQNYETRWQSPGKKPMRAYPFPFWKGNKLPSGRLLIWGEQGVGDEIMFAGLIPEVLRTGNHCTLDCDPRLVPLFARSFPTVDVFTAFDPETQTGAPITAHLPIASLPRLFRNIESAFEATTSPYLRADSAERDRFRARYTSGGKRIVGVAWHTKNPTTGPSRCIELALLAPLLQRKDIVWVSLQYGDHAELEQQSAAANAPLLIDCEVDQMANMDKFAAQVAAMDLVITIDNCTAHLAGALGVPVWLLPPSARDWRWLREREDSPWYPSMRLFRQKNAGDWQPVLQRVYQSLPPSE